ncbi:hypothetical protein C8R45DRAFT_524734 [Mycena sanguinolenta]|nr:hypothetical protein C8R45DRAFT_524734 [Mycena sanguinolenta]
MRAVVKISQRYTIISNLNSSEKSGHRIVLSGYVARLADSAQNLHDPVISCGLQRAMNRLECPKDMSWYHRICAWNLAQQRFFDISTSTGVNLGTMSHSICSIAFLTGVETPLFNRSTIFVEGKKQMPNGWSRFQSGDVYNKTLSIFFSISQESDWHTWLSQANHLFRRLHIVSDFEQYVVPTVICFKLHIPGTARNPPMGFLFLCSAEDFRIGPSSFRWPARPAYWSLDPSGIDRLNVEEATQLGFPPFQLVTQAIAYSWDTSVYEGLRQFHQAKGFDPYSQDIARHLGFPLFQLSSQRGSFAHVNGKDDVTDEDTAYTTADESKCTYPSACEVPSQSNVWHSRKVVHEEEVFAPSRSMNALMSIQLVSILFLALSWVYEQVPGLFV